MTRANPDLSAVLVQAEGDRAGDGADDEVARDAARPIGAGEHAVNQVDVEARTIGGDEKVITAAPLEDRVVHGRGATVVPSVGRREGDVGVDRLPVTPHAGAGPGRRDRFEAHLEQLRLAREGGTQILEHSGVRLLVIARRDEPDVMGCAKRCISMAPGIFSAM
jgi:hypothetical protein